jgi:hypothetical protein
MIFGALSQLVAKPSDLPPRRLVFFANRRHRGTPLGLIADGASAPAAGVAVRIPPGGISGRSDRTRPKNTNIGNSFADIFI